MPETFGDLRVEIRRLVSVTIDDDRFDDDESLFERGRLDSIAFLTLLQNLEVTYGIDIVGSEMRLETFRTIRSIAAFVASRRGEAPAS